MLKLQLKTAQDLKEEAVIQQRRRWEEERKKRIFNARERILGVDFAALDAQIKEKKQMEQSERERDRKLLNEQRNRDEFLQNKEQELNAERRRIHQELNNYRATYQKKEDSREYDLNDPQQNCQPIRSQDGDLRLGISSAQIFLGEDLMVNERRKTQNEQQKLWLQQQIMERRNAELARQQADKLLMEALCSRDRRALELDEQERNTRKRLQQETAEFNGRMAAEQEAKRLELGRQDAEDNLAVMYNYLTSDMLSENKNCTSNFGPHRKITTEYRGLSDEELQQLHEAQIMQAEDAQKLRKQRELEDGQWQQQAKNIARTVYLKEREADRQYRSHVNEVKEENRRLAEEHRSQKEYFDKVVYTNRPTHEYFDQFNTTTR